jgi:hypothetical protein
MTEAQGTDNGKPPKKEKPKPKPTAYAVLVGACSLIALGGAGLIVYLSICTLGKTKAPEIAIPSTIAWLAFIAILAQIFVNFLQWKSAEKQMYQNRELFELGNRPSLGIEFDWEDLPEQDAGIVLIELRNSGTAPAKNVTSVHTTKLVPYSDLKVCPKPDKQEPDSMESRGVVPVGGMRIRRTEIVGASELYSEKQVLFMWCRVTYESFVGAKYFVEGYAMFVGRTKNFFECPIGNDAD